ncbi:MAG: transcriptional regulator, partial [Chloroflexi bacterium]|nr:transcriptional regulator [Chloroflexota bacterium]
INLYQAQKGLSHAARIVRQGGRVVLLAACPEGSGSRSYEAWMEGINSPKEALERFAQEPFRVGPHKAYLIARDIARATTHFVSQMDPTVTRRLLFQPAATAAQAVAAALATLPADARVAVMPKASSTVPWVAQGD